MSFFEISIVTRYCLPTAFVGRDGSYRRDKLRAYGSGRSPGEISPRTDVAPAGDPGGPARRALSLPGGAGGGRGAPARFRKRGVGRRVTLPRAPARPARDTRRPGGHGREPQAPGRRRAELPGRAT